MNLPPVPDELLRSVSSATRQELEAAWELRPCVRLMAERSSDAPLERGFVARLFGRSAAEPVLPLLVSKAGGQPYAEEALDWSSYRFLLQIHLPEVHAAGPTVPGLPQTGLLALDWVGELDVVGAFRVRWYPDADAARAVPQVGVRSVGSHEARLRCEAGTSAPNPYFLTRDEEGAAIEGLVEELADAIPWDPDSELRLGGHPSHPWDDGVVQLLRMTYDQAAGIAWGSNAQYLLLSDDDLRTGQLGAARVHTEGI